MERLHQSRCQRSIASSVSQAEEGVRRVGVPPDTKEGVRRVGVQYLVGKLCVDVGPHRVIVEEGCCVACGSVMRVSDTCFSVFVLGIA